MQMLLTSKNALNRTNLDSSASTDLPVWHQAVNFSNIDDWHEIYEWVTALLGYFALKLMSFHSKLQLLSDLKQKILHLLYYNNAQ